MYAMAVGGKYFLHTWMQNTGRVEFGIGLTSPSESRYIVYPCFVSISYLNIKSYLVVKSTPFV